MGDAPVTRPGASFVVIHSTLHDPTDDRDGTRVRLEPRTHRSRVSALPRALVVLWTRNTRRLDARTLAVRLSSDACIPLRQPDVTRGPETRAARRARSASRRSPCDGSRPNKVLDTRLGVTSNERNVSRRLRRCRGQGLAYHGLGLLQDTAKMFCAQEALRVDLVDVLGPGRPRSEPSVLRDHLQPADRRGVARRTRQHALNTHPAPPASRSARWLPAPRAQWRGPARTEHACPCRERAGPRRCRRAPAARARKDKASPYSKP